MKIAMIINGTRGDVQPMLALAAGLAGKGHEVVFCAPPENRQLAAGYPCHFIEFGPNYKEQFKQKAGMKGGATTSPSPKEMKKQTGEQIDVLPGLLQGCGLILGAGFILGVHTVADYLRIPYRFVIFYPALLGTTGNDPYISRMLFRIGRSMTNSVMKGFINKKRALIGLGPIQDVWEHWMGDMVIAACDRELNEVREGVSFNVVQTAYMVLPSTKGLPAKVEQFLNAGEAPVFIGFGSNPIARPEKFKDAFSRIVAETHLRLIVSRGWAELPEESSENILYVDDISYEQLFPHIKAIVFHGGTGTMALAARAGIPQAAFPFMADQFENRKQIVKLGLGPKTCDFRKISAEAISTAIQECANNESYRKKAREVAESLQFSRGVEKTIELIENEWK